MSLPVYSLKIVTPQGITYEGTAAHASVPVESGGTVGVLANHAPYLVSSNGGKITVREESGGEKSFQVGPGFFEVGHNAAIFLTKTCAPD